MPDLELIVMVGIPCSGKSHYAKSLDDEIGITGFDKISRNFFGYTYDKRLMPYLLIIEENTIRGNITIGRSICVDNTNINKNKRERYINFARELGIPIRAVYCEVSLEVARQRNNAEKHVPDYVVVDMHNKLEIPCVDEGFYRVDIYPPRVPS